MKSLIVALLPLLAAASPVLNVGTIHKDAAPILSSSNAKEIPDSYIIKFKNHVKHADAQEHHAWVSDLHLTRESERSELKKRGQFPILDEVFEGLRHTYKIGDFLGYSGHFDEETIEQIRRHPDVESIEIDQEVHTLNTVKDDYETEKSSPWGLARISHRDSLSFSTYNKYLYSGDGGEGVDVYVIDTGTYIKHTDFEGRAHWGKTIPTGDADEDGNGHGTHCSGTIAGKKYGVAKKANVYAVKVLRSNGSGSMSDVVSGVEWAAEQHIKKTEDAKAGKVSKKWKGSAANMSLGGGKSPTLDRAVNAAVEVGIHFAVAAGNDNADSCNYSPASAEKAVTVGASTLADERAYFSNFGKCNDIFAPGLNIKSTWNSGENSTNTISGTSMASPHIAGLLAYYLSLQPAKSSSYAVAEITPAKLKKDIISIATVGALTDVPSSTTNILAWNGGGSSNYTDIVGKGGYTVKSNIVEDTLEEAFESLPSNEELEDSFNKAIEHAQKQSHRLSDKVQKLGKNIEALVEDELEQFFEEFRERRIAMSA